MPRCGKSFTRYKLILTFHHCFSFWIDRAAIPSAQPRTNCHHLSLVDNLPGPTTSVSLFIPPVFMFFLIISYHSTPHVNPLFLFSSPHSLGCIVSSHSDAILYPVKNLTSQFLFQTCSTDGPGPHGTGQGPRIKDQPSTTHPKKPPHHSVGPSQMSQHQVLSRSTTRSYVLLLIS